MGARLLAASVAAVSLVAACASSPGLVDNVYRGESTTYAVAPLPPAWRRVSLDGADFSFAHAPSGAALHVQSGCHRSDDVPLRALLGQLLIGLTDRRTTHEEVVSLDRREALHSVVEAKLDGVPMVLDVYILKKDGCVYDFTLVAAPDRIGAVQADFDRFVNGFHTAAGNGRP